MDRSSEAEMPGARTGGPRCLVSLTPSPAPEGVIPTLVIARSAATCHDDHREHRGVVFYDAEPVAWCCLSDDEVLEFKTWGARRFPAVQIVTVASPAPQINCPPSVPSLTQDLELRDRMVAELRSLAPRWFVPATPVASAKLVA